MPNRTHMDGFATVGKGNKKITPGYLWQRWCEGQDRGIYEEKKEGSETKKKNKKGTPTPPADEEPVIHSQTAHSNSIWQLSKEARKKLREQWNAEWAQPLYDQIQSTMAAIASNYKQLKSLRQRHDLKVLQSAKIIGCTTVGAANLHGLLEPTVVRRATCA